jgi:hypothetical protein
MSSLANSKLADLDMQAVVNPVVAPASGNLCGRGLIPGADVANSVRSLLAASYSSDRMIERRRDNRYPFPHLVLLAPVVPDGGLNETPPVVGVGRALSVSGLGFYHPVPLPYRRVIASIEKNPGEWVAFLMDLNWCRFNRLGWYESGGRFIQIVDSPLAQK